MYRIRNLIFLLISFLMVVYILDIMGGTIIEAIIVVVIGGIILGVISYLFQGPNLKVKHLKRQLQQKKPISYRHVIKIENKGRRTGELLDIVAKPTNNVKQSYLRVDTLSNLGVTPVSVDGKKTRDVWLDCYPNTKNTKYRIDVRYEKSIFNHVYEKQKTIWSN